MQKRLLISLTVFSGILWTSVMALLIFPNEPREAISHNGRAGVTIENKAPQDYGKLVEHLADIRKTEMKSQRREIASDTGITREWVRQMGDNEISIDELLASLQQDKKPPLDSSE